ncbi:hypothetical protein CWO90_06625 [Bradyrhizobium sp. Leo121]|nr:hypothetical protein CWO90_06625 [Bradyrhizobium sp. Leo121]
MGRGDGGWVDLDLHNLTKRQRPPASARAPASHFIKTVEGLHEALVGAVPSISFGLAVPSRRGPNYAGTPTQTSELDVGIGRGD